MSELNCGIDRRIELNLIYTKLINDFLNKWEQNKSAKHLLTSTLYFCFQTVRTSTEMRNECVVRLIERLIKDTKENELVADVMKKVNITS